MARVLKPSEKVTGLVRSEAGADEDLTAVLDRPAEEHCQVGVAGVPVEVREDGAVARDGKGRRVDALSAHGASRVGGAEGAAGLWLLTASPLGPVTARSHEDFSGKRNV